MRVNRRMRRLVALGLLMGGLTGCAGFVESQRQWAAVSGYSNATLVEQTLAQQRWPVYYQRQSCDQQGCWAP